MKYSIFVLLFLTSCGRSFEGERELGQVSALVRKRLVNENHLIPFGSGASWPDKCRAISYIYTTNCTATVPEARRALISALQVVIESANQVKNFEKHLAEPPFTEKNVWLRILFKTDSKSCKDDGLIEVVSIMFGKIHYQIDGNTRYSYEVVHEETYEEALQILREEGYL